LLHNDYVDGMLRHMIPLQEEILQDEKRRDDVCPSVGKELGRFLHLLILALKPSHVLELGTSMGYAAIWMGLALKEIGGTLTTIEYHQRLVEEAKRNIAQAGLHEIVTVLSGKAEDLLDELPGSYDMIVQDAGTKSYPGTLSNLIAKLSPGGILLADDVLFAVNAKRENPKKNMAEFNKRLMEDDSLFSTILSIGDGLSLSIKKTL